LNYATSYLDCSLIYGTTKNVSDDIREGSKGLLKTTRIGEEYYLPVDKEAECFNSSQGFCFKSGDLRTDLHPGMTLIQTLGMRVHNFCARRIVRINPYWDDERVFQECRRITVGIFQHITYTEYLPVILGWRFMYDYGILPPTKGYSYDYNAEINPWTLAEWTGAAFRLHSSVYGKIALCDENYKPEKLLNLEDYYNNAILYKNPKNFDKAVRGYIWARQRRIDEYYDESVCIYY
jgi:peroxidase